MRKIALCTIFVSTLSFWLTAKDGIAQQPNENASTQVAQQMLSRTRQFLQDMSTLSPNPGLPQTVINYKVTGEGYSGRPAYGLLWKVSSLGIECIFSINPQSR